MRVEIVLISPEGHRVVSAVHFAFKVTNIDAEYEALIAGINEISLGGEG